jgi:hypothetical protein
LIIAACEWIKIARNQIHTALRITACSVITNCGIGIIASCHICASRINATTVITTYIRIKITSIPIVAA